MNIDTDDEALILIVNSWRFGDSYLFNSADKKFLMLTSDKMSVRRK
jgi:hypothetical protein